MEVLTLNGKRYVKASKAAKDLGYASDYVGQLCRKGTVDAHLVGRTWYVNLDTLGAHRVEKRRNTRAKAREYARKSIAESRSVPIKKSTNTYSNIAIRYQNDESDLVPQVKKVHIATEEYVEQATSVDSSSHGTHEILNRDKKIIMSGSIAVFDVDEETPLTDVTILSPRIVRKHVAKEMVSEDTQEYVTQSEAPHSVPKTFQEKLSIIAEEKSPAVVIAEPEPELGVPFLTQTHPEAHTIRYLPSLAISFALIAVIISLGSLFIESKSDYTEESFETSIRVSKDNLVDFILKNKDLSPGR